jgi:lipopolysaccharide assembly protein A
MRVLVWLVRAFIFFTLFAFALNNQQPVTVNWFFGAQWQAPLVIVMLAVFAAGAALGVVAMLPGAWQRWRRSGRPARPASAAPTAAVPTVPPSGYGTEAAPRTGP